jgi:hypothetical protein
MYIFANEILNIQSFGFLCSPLSRVLISNDNMETSTREENRKIILQFHLQNNFPSHSLVFLFFFLSFFSAVLEEFSMLKPLLHFLMARELRYENNFVFLST